MTAPLGKVDAEELPWAPWTPDDVAVRLRAVDVTWAVAGGWAVDLFLGRVTRAHEDLEIVVPSAAAEVLLRAFPAPAWAWRVPAPDEMFPPDADSLSRHHQTWLWDAQEGAFVLDLFRNRHEGGTWVCHRDESITAPWSDVVAHTADGVPYLLPEVVLLYKAKHARPKDVADLENLVPRMSTEARGRLVDWLRMVHPGHEWLGRLT